MPTRINDWVARAFLVIAAMLAFLLCFLVVADVIGRVIFNSPIKGTTEVVSYSIVMICYLQASYAIRSGGMLNVDVFVSKMSGKTQSWFAAVGALLGAGFFAFLCWGSLDGAAHAWNSNEFEGEGALRVPVWPVRFVIVLGTALAAFSYLLMMLESIARARSGAAPGHSSAQH